jgi:hypothetical protein
MSKAIFLLVPALLAFCPVQSSAQDSNSWGSVFDCAVDWFSECKAFQEKRTDEPKQPLAARGNTFSRSGTSTAANLPLPVRNVLENPSLETARAYVLWSKQASERLAKASEYIAQATREINSGPVTVGNSNERINDLMLAGVGPVGLYYFFSPADETAAKDVAVLNKIWRGGKLGVVGIPIGGTDEEVGNYVNEAKPLFPIRRSDAEVKLVKPAETPDLYLALPLEKKMIRLGPTITETAIAETIGNILAAQHRGKASLDSLVSGR